MPAIAQTIIAQVREAVVDPPKDVSEFQCLDKATVDGVEYLAYRSVEAGQAQSSAPAHPVHRTVYVDPKTGAARGQPRGGGHPRRRTGVQRRLFVSDRPRDRRLPGRAVGEGPVDEICRARRTRLSVGKVVRGV